MECSTPGFLSFTISRSLLKLLSTESVMPSSHHICLSFIYLSMHHLVTFLLSNINYLHIIYHLPVIYHVSVICLTIHLK